MSENNVRISKMRVRIIDMPHPNALLDPRKEEFIIRTAKMKTISPLITFDCYKFTSFPPEQNCWMSMLKGRPLTVLSFYVIGKNLDWYCITYKLILVWSILYLKNLWKTRGCTFIKVQTYIIRLRTTVWILKGYFNVTMAMLDLY